MASNFIPKALALREYPKPLAKESDVVEHERILPLSYFIKDDTLISAESDEFALQDELAIEEVESLTDLLFSDLESLSSHSESDDGESSASEVS